MDRRRFLLVSLAGLAAPLAAAAQQAMKQRRVAFLAMGQHPSFSVFRQALQDLGYVDGENIILEPRFAEIDKPEQFGALAADLVRRGVDIIVALINPEIAAAKRATSTIPIVMVVGVDPVGRGFARSLARPGENVTGLAWDADPEFNAKDVEILKDLLPSLTHMGCLVDPALPMTTGWQAVQRGAVRRGVSIRRLDVSTPNEFEKAFVTMRQDRVGAVLVFGGSMLFGGRARIAELGVANRLPVMFGYSDAVQAGGLISYGPSLIDMWRRSATYVDRILRGAKPADIPIEQPTKFELVINLKTAKALGLTIPPSLLARADQVIE